MLDLLAIEIPSAPAAADNNSVLLWTVTVLTMALVAGVLHLKKTVAKNEAKCLADQTRCRAEMAAMHLKIEGLLTGVVASQASVIARQAEQTQAVVDALHRVCDEVGSGPHQAVDPKKGRHPQ